ncbi:hypothetical protein OCK74_23630 [Chitinophagaceae bacterium LB-8]|uniref:Alpha galactosidase C-terminal domain-containing protein n=1 Tax=Paraflavisolibacter caeni TaxID=2982496 RepID=A0A9X2Y054_9BACT|nr:hypothetical protein [Paraflavisolibacter caeni]MCU7552130.1 hypothetical protein [Paraflavisolibacter caeni]
MFNIKYSIGIRDVIAVNQDSLGIQGFQYAVKDSVENWFKPLQNGEWAMCFLNRSTKPQTVAFKWKEQEIVDTLFSRKLDAKNTVYRIRDLWTKKDLGTTKKDIQKTVPAHDILMVSLSVIK